MSIALPAGSEISDQVSAAGAVHISRVQSFVFRAPIEKTVQTSFGTMRDRPSVFVRIEDSDGCWGWGEVFCNWPAVAAEHRARLLSDDLSELVISSKYASPAQMIEELHRKTHVRAVQSGEYGPFWQCISGLDVALHDLFARRAGLPVFKYLSEDVDLEVPAYASGIKCSDAIAQIEAARKIGFNTFKLKVGFEELEDIRHIDRAIEHLRGNEAVAVDANQKWSLEQAISFCGAASEFGLKWIEEPIAADAPQERWRILAEYSLIPLAAGENIVELDHFANQIQAGILKVIQPDITKRGGISWAMKIAEMAKASSVQFCPHYLSGGIGLIASAHLMAAAQCDGILEMDVNPNPLRDAFLDPEFKLDSGYWNLENCIGLGIEQLPEEIEQYAVFKGEAHE